MNKLIQTILFLIMLLPCVYAQTIEVKEVVNLKGYDKIIQGSFKLEIDSKFVTLRSDSLLIMQRIIKVEHREDSNVWKYKLPCKSTLKYWIELNGNARAMYKYKDEFTYFFRLDKTR